ncbi:MAG: UDP-N-acetylmuramoyl-L-alanyl-D-glutamate--2,6-diaminopimelate ligase, partial [Gemmatimonadetes bacterium]|nr:UDP-N-acetylmuramoyl-L-alanyl-D-glutamate--2,6-diaminopimelate ligase [Gemmatimonadota bacterium]
GDRDRGKRATMGGLAAALADVAVFTSDNPRTEDPVAIVEEMLGGVADRAKVRIELDRERALAWAVEAARPGDVVLALGKGHERYQEVAGVKHPFDERAILARLASGRDSADAGGKRGDA